MVESKRVWTGMDGVVGLVPTVDHLGGWVVVGGHCTLAAYGAVSALQLAVVPGGLFWVERDQRGRVEWPLCTVARRAWHGMGQPSRLCGHGRSKARQRTKSAGQGRDPGGQEEAKVLALKGAACASLMSQGTSQDGWIR